MIIFLFIEPNLDSSVIMYNPELKEFNPDYSSGEKMSIARAFEIRSISFGDENLGLRGLWQVLAHSFRGIWYDLIDLLTTGHTSPMTIVCCNGLY